MRNLVLHPCVRDHWLTRFYKEKGCMVEVEDEDSLGSGCPHSAVFRTLLVLVSPFDKQ